VEICPTVYIPAGKYLCFLLPWTKNGKKIDKIEKTTGFVRRFKWINKDNTSNTLLHCRLKHKKYLSFLCNSYNNKNKDVSLI
jgi:hypothetical protein